MINKKASGATEAGRISTIGLYPKPTRRSRLERRIKTLFILNIILIASLMVIQILRVNTERLLSQSLWQLEEARAENDSLWKSILTLQSKNDELSVQNVALKTPTKSNLPICSTSTFKSWMDYRAITSIGSAQYKLQQTATTDPNYGFRMIDGYMAVAMSKQYGPVGTKYIIQFEDGKVIQAIIGDVKQSQCGSADGSILEFIIDVNVLPNSLKTSGNFNNLFAGSITMIREVE